MKPDSGLGPCPECGCTSIMPIGRPAALGLAVVSPLLAALVGAGYAQDLLCKECGARWALSDAEATDPWNPPRPHFPHTGADDLDEDALDAKWAQWGRET